MVSDSAAGGRIKAKLSGDQVATVKAQQSVHVWNTTLNYGPYVGKSLRVRPPSGFESNVTSRV